MIDWIFEHFFIVMIVFFVVVMGLSLWAYDGDVRCLVAECRIIKK